MTNEFQLNDDKILNVYPYGSVIYGTNTELSDEDFILIYDWDVEKTDSLQYGKFNATVYNKFGFQKELNNHEISALECYFLNDEFKYEKIKFEFKLNLEKLRTSISEKSSNSWVKSKKKLIDGEDYVGKKSLFHSLRILWYGIQIAKYGKIKSYQTMYDGKTMEQWWRNINDCKTWEELKGKYQEIYNYLKSEFKIIAPMKKD